MPKNPSDRKEDAFLKKFWLSVAYVAFLGGVSHFIGVKLPRRWFDARKFPYAAYPFERDGKIYLQLGIRKWKKRLPDMSRVSKQMLTKKVDIGATSSSIEALAAETCVAELVHFLLSVLSLAVLKFWDSIYGYIFVAIYILIGNVPFIVIQRYNRPQLIRVSDRLRRKECEKADEGTSAILQHG